MSLVAELRRRNVFRVAAAYLVVGWLLVEVLSAILPNLGAPENIRLANLESWTRNPDDGVKYFSGTATYTKTVRVPRDWLRSGTKIALDLGTVKDIAQVSINGKTAATLWKPPCRC